MGQQPTIQLAGAIQVRELAVSIQEVETVLTQQNQLPQITMY